MGIWQKIFAAVSGSEPYGARHNTRRNPYDTWIKPPHLTGNEEWQRKLRNYAKKCAQELTENDVPRWQSREPRDGKGTFDGAFWAISVDIDRAERHCYQFELSRGVGSKAGEFGGNMQGDALILTPLGGLFNSRVEMWFPPSGNHEEVGLDSIFHQPSTDLIGHSPWAGLNVGRWRRRTDGKVYGATHTTFRSEFRSKYPPHSFSGTDLGKGSSIALNKFVRSKGRTQWPRYFDEYYGR